MKCKKIGVEQMSCSLFRRIGFTDGYGLGGKAFCVVKNKNYYDKNCWLIRLKVYGFLCVILFSKRII